MSTLAPDRSEHLEVVRPGRWLGRIGRYAQGIGAPRERSVAVPLPGAAVTVIWISVAISVLAGWLVLYAFVLSGLQQSRTNAVLYSTLRENLSAATTPIGGSIEPGTPIALLQAPRAGLPNEVIVEGTAPQDLRAGPGHLRTTPLPGQAGVSVLYGRSATFGAPFGELAGLHKGDPLTVTTGQGAFTYLVDRVRRPGDPLPSILPAGGSRLLLETSAGSRWAPTTTLFVDATLKGKPQPTPPGRPNAVPAFEHAMNGDSSVLLPLVLWLQALVLVTIGVVWARARWGKWQAWVVGVPLLVAVLWGTSSTAMMLVPNLV